MQERPRNCEEGDVTFIDVYLPAMTGLDLYLALKKITPASVAIMISETNAGFDEIAREAVRQTAYTVIRKPLNLEAALDLLDRLTGQRVSDKLRKPDPNTS